MKKVVVFTRSVLLLSAFLLIMFFGSTMRAEAATYDKAINLQMVTSKYTRLDRYVIVKLEKEGDHITNLKCSNKHLRAIVSSSIWIEDSTNSEVIDVYATKRGKYNITFDIVDGAGNLRSKESIKVYVKSPKESLNSFKSIKLGKLDLKKNLLKDDYTKQTIDIKKTGKLKVKMNKGCKLKDIHVRRYKKLDTPKEYSWGDRKEVDSEYVEIKNGSYLELSGSGDEDGKIENSGNQVHQIYKSTYATTRLEIEYTDKKGILETLVIVLRSVNR